MQERYTLHFALSIEITPYKPTVANYKLTMNHYQLDGEGDVLMTDVTSPRRIAQPHPRLGHVTHSLSIAYQNLRPVVDPALHAVTNTIQRGVKRAADSFLETRDRFFEAWIETRRSNDDGLIIKRFKRLPIDPKKTANPNSQRANTLPVNQLKALPNDQFCWTSKPLAYLGPKNHARMKKFFSDFIDGMKVGKFAQFPWISHVIDPSNLPSEVKAEIQSTSSNEPLSIVLHNHMIKQSGELHEDSFDDACQELWSRLHQFDDIYRDIYHVHGRLAIYKYYDLKPYGPLEFPYEYIGRSALAERKDLLLCIDMLQFFLSQRSAFNQMFPVEAIAGIIADLDAIHKDEPAPSHVDWPGKYECAPGSYPEDSIHTLLFETVAERDFKPTRFYDHKHPSPSKDVITAKFDHPHRKAMQKNPIYYDGKGQARPKKTHLRKQPLTPTSKKHARFVTSPISWYIPSENVPVAKKEFAPPTPATPATPPKQTGDTSSDTRLTLTMQKANEEAKFRGDAPMYTNSRPTLPKRQSPKYKSIDDFFDNDDKGPFGRGLQLKISTEKAAELEIRQQLIQDAALQSQHEADRIAEEKRRLEEEERLRAEQERLRIEEELLLAEQRRIEEEDRLLAESGELREAHRNMIPDISTDWTDKVMNTLRARNNTELAKSPDGTVLQRKDFETVVPQNQWLNDEIINATLLHLGNYINQKAGIKNTRVHTPKLQVFNSFVGKNLDEGRPPTERMLRRAGIRKDNFLDIETILIPLCRGKHWTIMAMRPKHRQIFHLDSLSSSGDQSLISKVINWVQSVLGDDFVEDEWEADTLPSPRQSNFDDCGVHTITNGICIGLGINPSSYKASMMPMQRLHVAAVLINGGFVQEFSLNGI